MRLPKDLMGKARLGHMYEEDVIEFEITRLGRVTVYGKLQDPEQELGFCFSSDQAGLSIMLSSIERLLQEANDSR